MCYHFISTNVEIYLRGSMFAHGAMARWINPPIGPIELFLFADIAPRLMYMLLSLYVVVHIKYFI